MAQFEKWSNVDLTSGVVITELVGPLFVDDNKANKIGVNMFKNGLPYTPTDATCSVMAILSNGTTVNGNGVIAGNKAYVEVPNEMYAVPGKIMIALRVKEGTEHTVVGLFEGYVRKTSTGTIVIPDNTITNPEELLERFNELEVMANQIKVALRSVGYYVYFRMSADPGTGTSTITGATYTISENGYRWKATTKAADAATDNHYVIYNIPENTVSLQLCGYQNGTNYPAYVLYNDDMTQELACSVASNGHTGWITVEPPSWATKVYINVVKFAFDNPNESQLRGVREFQSDYSYIQQGHEAYEALPQSLRMFGETINSFDTMKVKLPCSTDSNKASFDEAVLGVSYFIGFRPGPSLEYPNIVGMPVRSSGTLITTSASASYTTGAMQLYYASINNSIYIRFKFGGAWREWKEITPKETVYYVGSTRTVSEYEDVSLVDLLMRDGFSTSTDPKIIYIDQGEYDLYQDYLNYDSIMAAADQSSTSGFANVNPIIPANTKVIGLGNVVLNFLLPSTVSYNASRLWSCLNLTYGNTTVENVTLHCKNCRYGIHDESNNVYKEYTNYYKRVNIIMEEADQVTVNGSTTKLGFGPTIGFGFEDSTTYIFEDCHFTNYCNAGVVSAFYGHDGSSVGGAQIIATNCIFETFDADGNPVVDNNSCIRLQSIRDWNNSTSNPCVATFNNCYMTGGIRLQNYGGEGHTGGANYGGMWDAVFLNCKRPTGITVDTAKRMGTVSVYNEIVEESRVSNLEASPKYTKVMDWDLFDPEVPSLLNSDCRVHHAVVGDGKVYAGIEWSSRVPYRIAVKNTAGRLDVMSGETSFYDISMINYMYNNVNVPASGPMGDIRDADGNRMYVMYMAYYKGYLYVAIRAGGDPDSTSTPNSFLAVINTSNMSTSSLFASNDRVSTITIDNRVSGKPLLIVGERRGRVSIYDISTPGSPVLRQTISASTSVNEFQHSCLYEHGNTKYFAFGNYTTGASGYSISVSGTTVSVGLVWHWGRDNLLALGSDLNCFAVAVKWPYAYVTISPTNSGKKLGSNMMGIAVLDISDLTDNVPSMVGFYKIPEKDCGNWAVRVGYELPENATEYVWSYVAVNDPHPSLIRIVGNRVYINNEDKGLAVFEIGSDGSLSYKGLIDLGVWARYFEIYDIGTTVSSTAYHMAVIIAGGDFDYIRDKLPSVVAVATTLNK